MEDQEYLASLKDYFGQVWTSRENKDKSYHFLISSYITTMRPILTFIQHSIACQSIYTSCNILTLNNVKFFLQPNKTNHGIMVGSMKILSSQRYSFIKIFLLHPKWQHNSSSSCPGQARPVSCRPLPRFAIHCQQSPARATGLATAARTEEGSDDWLGLQNSSRKLKTEIFNLAIAGS